MPMNITRRQVIASAEAALNEYLPVLDYGFVSLVDYWGSDQMNERAARNSYDFQAKPRKKQETTKLTRHLFREYHSSPSEFSGWTAHVGAPIFVVRQLFRHRTLKLNEFSGRYSIIPLMFYEPPADRLKKQCSQNKQGSGERLGEEKGAKFSRNINRIRKLTRKVYTDAIGDDLAREIARIDLPQSTYTYFYMSVDLRNGLHLTGLRSDSHAQEEIRDYSDIFMGFNHAVAPISTQAFLDYQFNAVRFTQIELEAIKRYYQYVGQGGTWTSEELMEIVNDFMKSNHMAERERKDFWAKLGPKVPRDFTLDLANAKEASYYENLINSFAVELPQEG